MANGNDLSIARISIYRYHPAMNWKSIVQELCSSGLTQAQIASEVGVKQSTIAGILSGAQKDMRWGNGERLRGLHARRILHPEPSPATETPDAHYEGGHA